MNLKISIISPLVALALGACDLPSKNLGEANTDTAGDSTAAATEGGSESTDGESTDGESTDSESTDGESTAAEPGTTGTTAEPGETETTAMDEGETTEGEPGQEDFDEMSQCELPVVCDPVIYATGPEDKDIESWPLCLWTGLRDGTVGRYTWITDREFDNAQVRHEHLIHVHADRKVTFAVYREEDIWEGGDDVGFFVGYDPAKTCTLVEPELFDNCLQDPEKFAFDGCLAEKKWWADCVEEGPKCE